MTIKKIVLAATLALTAATAAHSQALNSSNNAFGPPSTDGVERRSVYRPQPTEPGAFFNESDERGGRNYGDRENPELGQ